MPEGLSFEQAACLPTAGVTAWNGLVDKAKLKSRQRVFVNGCAGSVGEAAVQLAKMLGAEVAGSCSGASFDKAVNLGVDPVYDYQRTTPMTIRDRFDVAYDTSAKMPLFEGFHLLRKGGVFLDINPSPLKFLRSFVDRRLKVIICTPRPKILDELAAAAAQGKLRVTVGETVPLSDAINLITVLEQGHKINGKGLVMVNSS
jgi:NADPH:quinone reductase-like Zn-dependent oxidoreductase